MRFPFFPTYLRYHRIFRHYTGRRIHFLSLLGLLSGYLDSIGIAVFIPLLSTLLGKSGQGGSGVEGGEKFSRLFEKFLAPLGLNDNPTRIVGVVLALFIVKGIFKFIFGVYQAYVVGKLIHDLTDEMTGELGRMKYRAFLNLDGGTLTNVTTNEINRMSGAFLGFVSMIPAVASMAASALIAFAVNWRLTLMTLGFGAIVLLASRVTFRLSRKYSHFLSERYSVLYGLLIQTIASYKYLRATGRFQSLHRRIQSESSQISRVGVKAAVTSQIVAAMLEPVVIGFLVVILYFESQSGRSNFATLAVLAMLSYRIMTQIGVFQGAWQRFSASIGNVDVVMQTLRRLRSEVETNHGSRLPAFDQGLEIREVSFTYGERDVLDQISLRVRKNEQIALVGESGSGKSTLIDIICGLLTPTKGSIFIDDIDGREVDWEKFKSRIGYVTQDSVLFNDSIRNNILFWESTPDDAQADLRLEDSIRSAHLTGALADMSEGTATVIGDRGSRLSGGQRQRLSFARELYKEPSLLILDEATSSLDSESEEIIRQTIDGLRGKITTIIVAHRLHTVRNCDRIYVMSRGKVVEVGSYDELHAREGSLFRRLCDLQNLSER